jgi:hypothetical protein
MRTKELNICDSCNKKTSEGRAISIMDDARDDVEILFFCQECIQDWEDK